MRGRVGDDPFLAPVRHLSWVVPLRVASCAYHTWCLWLATDTATSEANVRVRVCSCCHLRIWATAGPMTLDPVTTAAFSVFAPGEDVAKLYYGLFALQHRGQESAGLAVSNGDRIMVFKDMGLVSQVFDEPTLNSLTGHLAIGHTRYSTTRFQ